MKGRHQQGIVLVLVLWALVLLTVIVSAVSSSVHTETSLAHNQLAQTHLRAQADAAFYYAAARAFDLDAENAWIQDTRPYLWRFQGVEMVIRLQAERDRLNLNEATEAQLQDLLADLQVDPEQQATLVAAILDWRDADDLHRLNGAEDDDYRSASLPYGAKDAPFTTVNEVGLVKGISPQLQRLLIPRLMIPRGSKTTKFTLMDFDTGSGFANTVHVYLEIPAGNTPYLAEAEVSRNRGGIRVLTVNYGVSPAEWPRFVEE
jgi:general secretion pathway protein K